MAQGTVGAGLLSAVNLDNGVNAAFAGSEGEVTYFDLPLNPIIYMDDIERIKDNVKSAQEGNNRIEQLADNKCLELNLDKSNYTLVGNKKARRKLKGEIEQNQLTICGKPMKEVNAIKFLGDYITHNHEESIHLTIMKRVGDVKQAVLEIRAVVEDRSAKHIGGINIAFDIQFVDIQF